MLITHSRSQENPTPQKSAPWSDQPETGANQAISLWGLKKTGWMGFDKLPWVAKLKDDYPQAVELSRTCSATRPEYLEQAEELFGSAPVADRPRLRDYFAGKLGLEELSCRMSGAGAGMCDKRSAFQEIYRIGNQACKRLETTPPPVKANFQAEEALWPEGVLA